MMCMCMCLCRSAACIHTTVIHEQKTKGLSSYYACTMPNIISSAPAFATVGSVLVAKPKAQNCTHIFREGIKVLNMQK